VLLLDKTITDGKKVKFGGCLVVSSKTLEKPDINVF